MKAVIIATSLWWVVLALAPNTVSAATTRDKPTLRVVADSNLKGAFEELAILYNRDHRTEVTFTFVEAATPGKQILNGTPINVFASANSAQLEVVQRATGKTLGKPQVFARGRAVYRIAAYAEGPVQMQSLARDFVDLVMGPRGRAVLTKWGFAAPEP